MNVGHNTPEKTDHNTAPDERHAGSQNEKNGAGPENVPDELHKPGSEISGAQGAPDNNEEYRQGAAHRGRTKGKSEKKETPDTDSTGITDTIAKLGQDIKGKMFAKKHPDTDKNQSYSNQD